MFWSERSKGFLGLFHILTRLTVGVYFSLSVLALAAVAQASPSSVRELPEELQGAVSGAIGLDDPSYHVERAGEKCRGVNAAQQFEAVWSEGGLAVQAGKLNWGLRLEAWGYGEELAPAGGAVPQAGEHRVEYQRCGLTEWYVNGPMGIEQGFTVLSAPKGASSGEALTLSLAWSGESQVQIEQNAAVVSNFTGEPVLRYSGLSAHDASGRDLGAWLEQRGAAILLRVDDREATYPVVIDPLIQQQKLTASDASAGAFFGASAALSADGATALIGADGNNKGQGAAYVFVKSGGTWSQQQKLTAPGGAGGDSFGISAALSADGATALIGANGNNNGQGAAYVFALSGGTWTQQQKLYASGGAVNNYFGCSAALSADGATALIGANNASPGGITQAGAAYIFVRSGVTWTQKQRLTALDAALWNCFGSSTALSAHGATALIGAPAAGGNTQSGAAYVFVRSGSIWIQKTKLTAADGVESDQLGCSAALSADGSTALVGAFWAAVSGRARQGAAYVFALSGGTWGQQTKLTASDGAVNNYFGCSAALSTDGNTALIGAYGGESGYLFYRQGVNWTPQEKVRTSDRVTGDEFGYSAALSADGAIALIGAWDATVSGNALQGAAYVFNSHGLVVNFGASGVWYYGNRPWRNLTPLTPSLMAVYGNNIVALFQGAGLYQYNGAAWTQLTPIPNINLIVGMTDRVYVSFTGAGLWQYNGAWTRITALNANRMIAFGNKLLANFPGYGLYQYDGASWMQLTPTSTADSMVASASTVYVNFPSAGLYAYNGGTWTGLTSLNSTMMTIYGNVLVANFAGYGIYSYYYSWTQLTPSTAAQGLIAVWPNCYVNFGTSGLFKFNQSWTQATPLAPNLMGSMGPSLIANFSGYGLYAFDGSAWSQLTSLGSATATIEASWP